MSYEIAPKPPKPKPVPAPVVLEIRRLERLEATGFPLCNGATG